MRLRLLAACSVFGRFVLAATGKRGKAGKSQPDQSGEGEGLRPARHAMAAKKGVIGAPRFGARLLPPNGKGQEAFVSPASQNDRAEAKRSCASRSLRKGRSTSSSCFSV